MGPPGVKTGSVPTFLPSGREQPLPLQGRPRSGFHHPLAHRIGRRKFRVGTRRTRVVPYRRLHAMWFVVKFREGHSPTTDEYPHVVLVQDNWDDYGYKTTFSATLHLRNCPLPRPSGRRNPFLTPFPDLWAILRRPYGRGFSRPWGRTTHRYPPF
jgi:hypothetical protein